MINHILNKIVKEKEKCVYSQKFEEATCWRDAERNLNGYGDIKPLTMINFMNYIKSMKNSYINFDEIYQVIKPLEVKLQRKSKIEKLYKKK